MRKAVLILGILLAVVGLTAAYFLFLGHVERMRRTIEDLRIVRNSSLKTYRAGRTFLNQPYVIDSTLLFLRHSDSSDFRDTVEQIIARYPLAYEGIRPSLSHVMYFAHVDSSAPSDLRAGLMLAYLLIRVDHNDTTFYHGWPQDVSLWWPTKKGVFYARYAGDSMYTQYWKRKALGLKTN